MNIGLLGIGTVGGGVFELLKTNIKEIQRKTSADMKIVAVADKNLARAKEIVGSSIEVTDDAFKLVADKEIDVIVELIGGTTIAKELVVKAIENKKHVVTANKALLANFGNELFDLAKKNNVTLAFEASVAGGIPILKSIREGLAGNKIEWVAGIINGTTNFILTEMRDKGITFAKALSEAQSLGYAEADPTFDIEGIDAGYNLNASYDCPGKYKVGNRDFTNYESKAMGRISLKTGIAVSCDTLWYKIAYSEWLKDGGLNPKNPNDYFFQVAHEFQLDKKTGIDLPGELEGRIPDRQWKIDYWKQNKNFYCNYQQRAAKKDLTPFLIQLAKENCIDGGVLRAGDAVNFSIGQGDTVITPLKLAQAYDAIVS